MAANRSILELMTSPFGSESKKYCSSKVLLEAKHQDQRFFHNIRQRDFDSAAQAPCWSKWPAWGIRWRVKIALTLFTKKNLVWELSLQNHFGRAIFHWLWAKRREKSLSPKLTNWRPFKLQNSNGHGGLNFWATPFRFWKSTYLLKLFKWFYYT